MSSTKPPIYRVGQFPKDIPLLLNTGKCAMFSRRRTTDMKMEITAIFVMPVSELTGVVFFMDAEEAAYSETAKQSSFLVPRILYNINHSARVVTMYSTNEHKEKLLKEVKDSIYIQHVLNDSPDGEGRWKFDLRLIEPFRTDQILTINFLNLKTL